MAIDRTPEEKRQRQEEQLRQMLKKAETTTPAEAEMIMKQVERLMMKLGIEDMMSVIDDKKDESIVTIEVAYEGVYAAAYVQMAYAVVLALGNLEAIRSTVYKQGTYKKAGLKLTVVGHASDANRAKILLDSLSLQAVTAVTAHMKKVPSFYSASEKYNVKRSFILGFGRGAGERIKSTRQEVVQEATVSEPGTALVLADRGTIVRQAFEQLFPSTKPTRGMSIRGDGYGAGKVAGRQARTGETEVGGTSGRKAIG